MNLEESFSGKEILNWRKVQLSKGGSRLELDWLLDIGGGLGSSELVKLKLFQNRKFQLDLSLKALSKLWVSHLDDQIPLQYLVGKCPWRDFLLEVNNSALIPRPETELLIDIALSKIELTSNEYGIWVDLGTGSGALAVALARALPRWIGHAVDCNQDALALAQKNLKNLALGSNVSLHLGDWWKPLDSLPGKVNLVVANPPYIPKKQLSEIDRLVLNHEPHLALCGGEDGMDCCRQIIKGAKKFLSSGGWLMFEHHYDQSNRALEMLIHEGFFEVDFANDLEGIRRFALGRNP